MDSLEKKINDLSLLLVMTDGSDSIAQEAAVDVCNELVATLSADPTRARLVSAAQFMLAERATRENQAYYDLVGEFVSAAQSFIANGTAKFPHEVASDSGSSESEYGAHFDPSFVVEFIEKHTLLLSEFEGWIVDYRSNREGLQDSDRAAFSASVKSYLHNIKGDSGAIGWNGIENVTHKLESFIADLGIDTMLDSLLAYREWLESCFAAYANEMPIPVTSTAFLGGVGNPAAAAAAANPVPAPAASVDADDILASVAQQQAQQPAPTAPAPVATAKVRPAELGSYTISSELELLSEFVAEAEDHLNQVEEILLGNIDDMSSDNVDTMFRAVHSLKGASAYFNLVEINYSSHTLETVLDEVRDGKRQLDAAVITFVFGYLDLQKQLMNNAKKAMRSDFVVTKSQSVIDYVEALELYAKQGLAPKSAHKSPTPVGETPSTGTATASAFVAAVETPVPAPAAYAVEPAPDAHEDHPEPSKAANAAARQGDHNRAGIKTFVKIDTARLDSLVDSIGEMVIYSSMLVRQCRNLLGDNESVIKTSHQVEKFSRELQDIGMSMRLDPIKGLFQKMSRLVWDTSKKLGKEINFHMKGEDTELDRTVIENLADPLMHMVRNAIDHGIEQPEDRVRAGKTRAGNIHLSAYHSGGSIHILIEDDGHGLDPEKLKAKAIEKGVLPANAILSEQEAFFLIFAAGFSTAAAITDISGRGVGMDVVRNNIESMRGHIRIESKVGHGSTFVIELPLTLAIMDGIEAIVGRERFIIPTLSVLEFIKPTENMLGTTIGRGESFYFRGNHIPLFRLARLFQIENAHEDPTDSIIVVLENGREQVALMVDDLVQSCQTVIKNLGPMFQGAPGLAGCAIMTNGDIGLIVDVRSLVQLARSGSDASFKLPSRHDKERSFTEEGASLHEMDARGHPTL